MPALSGGGVCVPAKKVQLVINYSRSIRVSRMIISVVDNMQCE